MGWMRHHAIVVTSWKPELIEKAHKRANDIGLIATPVTQGAVNNFSSFCVIPDGSKEGWDESNEFDEKRAMFKKWLHKQRYDDDSTSIDWVEIQFGDDGLETKAIEDSDYYRRTEPDL